MTTVSKERADAILARHTPTGWTVAQTKRRTKTSSANADPTGMQINVPVLTDAKAINLFLHEVAHVNLGHFRLPPKAAHVKEYEAEQMAMTLMKLEGIPMSPELLQAGKDYVREHIEADEKKGLPIAPSVRKWCGQPRD